MCLLRYLEYTVGCRLPYLNSTKDNKEYPVCDAIGARELMYEYGKLIDGGERDIFLISGCLSRLVQGDHGGRIPWFG